ncbi:MAG: phage terminase large subunit [Alphaproteobacteria bacterium]
MSKTTKGAFMGTRNATGATKVSPTAQAYLGQPYECDTCGEVKPLGHETFSPLNKSKTGWHTTCRSCQGGAARNKPKPNNEIRNKPGKGKPVLVPPFTAHPYRETEAFVTEVSEAVSELTRLSEQNRPDLARKAELLSAIKAATLMRADPAGGGLMTDERVAFWTFVHAVIRPLLPGWREPGVIHDDIVSGLLSKERDILILASRGSAKSTYTAFYALWRLWRDPVNETILVVSQGESHARDMLRMVRGFIEWSPVLEDLRPEDEDPDNASSFVVGPASGKLGMSVSFRSIGITGQITGKRARLIILDDVETPKHDTADSIDKLQDQISEAHNVLVPDPYSRVVVLGTPQSEMSLYGRLVEEGSWDEHRACLFDSDILDGKEVFHSRWPDRFSAADIESRKRKMSTRLFALHWRIDLTQAATNERPIKIASLPVVDIEPGSMSAPIVIRGGGDVLQGLPKGHAEEGDNWHGVSEASQDCKPYVQTVAAVDPAGGLVGKGDAIGLSIVSSTAGGRVIIRRAIGVRAHSTGAAIQECARIIVEHKANRILVEQEKDGLFASQLAGETARRGYPIKVDPVTTGKQRKGRRIIETLAPAFASGRVLVCRGVLTDPEHGVDFVNQLTGVKYDGRGLKNDDIVDALSYAVAAFQDILSVDEASMVAGARFNVEELKRLPLRQCLIPEEDLELWAGEDENAEELRQRRDALLITYNEEVAMGLPADDLLGRIQAIEGELAKYQRGGYHVRHGVNFNQFRDRIAENIGG